MSSLFPAAVRLHTDTNNSKHPQPCSALFVLPINLDPPIYARAVAPTEHNAKQVDPEVEVNESKQHLHRPAVPPLLLVSFTHFQSLRNVVREYAVQSPPDAPVHGFFIVDGPAKDMSVRGFDLLNEFTAGWGDE